MSAEHFPPPDYGGGWHKLANPTEIRQKTSVDVKKLDEAFEYIKGSSNHGGLLVVRKRWLVYEQYLARADRETTPNTASCGKSFTSIAMGILMRQRIFPPTGVISRVTRRTTCHRKPFL